MRKSYFVFLCAITILYSENVLPQNILADLLTKINTDSMLTTIKELSGFSPVVINGNTCTISGRVWYKSGKELARKYLQQRFTNYGISNSVQEFDSITGKNIIATIPGSKYPEKKFIICAHYDDMSTINTFAPGSDDNASGVAVVLEAARLFQNSSSPYTVIFALWDEEERGRIGSIYYASHLMCPDSVLGVLNIDMVGYDLNNDSKLELMAQNIGSSVTFANKIREINTTYNIGLNFVYFNPGYRFSDHASFWDYNIGAICLIEDTHNELNPKMHTTGDSVTYINPNYITHIAQAAILTFVSFTGMLPVKVGTEYFHNLTVKGYSLLNYPNPFNPITKITYTIPTRTQVKLKVYNLLSEEVMELVNQEESQGEYNVDFSGGNLPSGMYIYQLQTDQAIITKSMLLLK